MRFSPFVTCRCDPRFFRAFHGLLVPHIPLAKKKKPCSAFLRLSQRGRGSNIINQEPAASTSALRFGKISRQALATLSCNLAALSAQLSGRIRSEHNHARRTPPHNARHRDGPALHDAPRARRRRVDNSTPTTRVCRRRVAPRRAQGLQRDEEAGLVGPNPAGDHAHGTGEKTRSSSS